MLRHMALQKEFGVPKQCRNIEKMGELWLLCCYCRLIKKDRRDQILGPGPAGPCVLELLVYKERVSIAVPGSKPSAVRGRLRKGTSSRFENTARDKG